MSTKAAPLLGDLVSVKGQASVPVAGTVEGAQTLTGPVRALTVKMDDNRYKLLKLRGLQEGKTTQDLLVQAVDLLLRGS